MWSLVLLQSDRLKSVIQGLPNVQGELMQYHDMTAAGSLITAVAPLTVFLVFQRYFIKGLTVGADKG